MKHVIFSTGNHDKFLTAKHVCEAVGIDLTQNTLDIPEIQGEDGEVIARDKAAKAYALIGKPVVVTDDSWLFVGLNGFPGAYMKSMNHWLSAEDFLRLAEPLTDRTVILDQYLAFTDGQQSKLFKHETKGTLLREKRGEHKDAVFAIVTFEEDNGQSISEVYAQGGNKAGRSSARVWHDFAKWYLSQS